MSEPKIDLFGDKQVILYRNQVRGKTNPTWQAIITTPSSTGRIRTSLKTTSLDEAKAKARDEYYRAEARVQSGLPLQAARFDKTAKEYLQWLQNELNQNRTTKNKFDTHNAIISNLLVPHFGDTLLHNIGTKDVERYQDQRKQIGASGAGKAVKGSTLNRDASILNAVFTYAIREDYIKEAPLLPNHHHFEQRASFSRAEMKVLQRKLDEWVNKIDKTEAPHVKHYRELFRLYVLIISYSGIRPGKEMASLRWDEVLYRKSQNKEYVKLSVITSKNKKGQIIHRGVIAMPQLKKHIEHIKSIEALYKPDDYIFIHPATTQLAKSFIGKPIGSFKKQWGEFIKFAGLEREAKPPHRTRQLYSCRHYYFEQRMLNGDVTLHALAQNGGTSIQVIEKWYAEIQAEQYAASLSGLIEKENR